MKNSHWKGSFAVDIEVGGGAEGSASVQGDLDFTVTNPQQPTSKPPTNPPPTLPIPIPPYVDAILGTFRLTFTSNLSMKNVGDTIGAGPETGSGSAVGNLAGYYDAVANTVKITHWGLILTQASGSYVTGKGTPSQTTTPFSMSASVPAGPGNPPSYYGMPAAAQPPRNDPGLLLPGVEGFGPIILNLKETVQAASNSRDMGIAPFYTQTNHWTFNLTPPKYTIKVECDETDLDPTGDPTTQITITVTDDKGNASKQRDVDITVCPAFGTGPGGDGHALHDSSGGDPCDPRPRPPGSIDGVNAYPVTKTTDGAGTITAQYTAPMAQNPPQDYAGTYYISGIDTIKAQVDDPTIQDKSAITDDTQQLQTWVKNLEPMPGSADGSGAQISFDPSTGSTTPRWSRIAYGFGDQSNHGYIYYGTTATNSSLVRIANDFIAAQLACQKGNDPSYGKNPVSGNNLHTPDDPHPMLISAMSLPWGGLNDIGGDWNPPHGAHDTGKVADIGFAQFRETSPDGTWTYDYDRIFLLLSIIQADPNVAGLPVAAEGGDMALAGKTFANPRAHFHVQFKQ